MSASWRWWDPCVTGDRHSVHHVGIHVYCKDGSGKIFFSTDHRHFPVHADYLNLERSAKAAELAAHAIATYIPPPPRSKVVEPTAWFVDAPIWEKKCTGMVEKPAKNDRVTGCVFGFQ